MNKTSPLKANQFHRVVVLLILSLLIIHPWQHARADIGDKPTLNFVFIFEGDTPLTITEGVLYACSDSACTDRQPLRELGPQRFTCTESSCSATTYGHPDFMQLEITFSDGFTRQSDVFTTSGFHVRFSVAVGVSSLTIVEESTSGPSASDVLPAASFIADSTLILTGLIVIAFVVLIILLIVSIMRSRKGIFTFDQSRWIFILAWITAAPLIILGGITSLNIPLTILIEGVIAYFYARFKRLSSIRLITLSLLLNILTLTGLLFILAVIFAGWEYLPVLIITEIIIWGVEATLFKLALRHELSWAQSFGFSALLNLPTFIFGLFLPNL